jgi:hypothetical protein
MRIVVLAALLLSIHVHAATLEGRVTQIVDGDTLDVIVKVRASGSGFWT